MNKSLKLLAFLALLGGFATPTVKAIQPYVTIDEPNSAFPYILENYYTNVSGNGSQVQSAVINKISKTAYLGQYSIYNGNKLLYYYATSPSNYFIIPSTITNLDGSLAWGSQGDGTSLITTNGKDVSTIAHTIVGNTTYGTIYQDSNNCGTLNLANSNTTTINFPNSLEGSTTITAVVNDIVYGNYSDTNSNSLGFTFDGNNYTSQNYPINETPRVSITTNSFSGGRYTEIKSTTSQDTFNPTGNLESQVVGNIINSTITHITDYDTGVIYADEYITNETSNATIFDGTNFNQITNPSTNPTITTAVGVQGNAIFLSYTSPNITGPVFGWDNGALILEGTNFTDIPNNTTNVLLGASWVYQADNNNGILGEYVTTNTYGYQTEYHQYDLNTHSYGPAMQGILNGTTILGISSNTYIGTYVNTQSYLQGFYFNGTNYTDILPPNANPAFITPIGIINNQVVGTYVDINNNIHGFLLSGTNYTVAEYPNTFGQTTFDFVSGTNIAGTYKDTNSIVHLFIKSGTNYTAIPNIPSTTNSPANITGFSGSTVIGTYPTNVTHIVGGHAAYTTAENYPLVATATTFKTITLPWNTKATPINTIIPTGINGTSIIGSYYDEVAQKTIGFYFNGKSYKKIDFSTIATYPSAIASGMIVGSYTDNNRLEQSFTYDGTNFANLAITNKLPGVAPTSIIGIEGNKAYGSYIDTNGITHGFISTVKLLNTNLVVAIPPQTNGALFQLPSTSSYGIPITYTVLSGAGAISNNTIIFTGVGKVVLKSSTANNAYYNATSTTNTITVAKAPQTLTIPPQVFGGTYTLPTTNSLGQPLTYSLVSNWATLSNNTLTFPHAGSDILVINNGSNAFATPIIINKAPQTITFPVIDTTFPTNMVPQIPSSPFTGGFPTTSFLYPSNAISSSGLPVSITYTGAAVGPFPYLTASYTQVNGAIIPSTTGKITFTASQSGNENYLPAKAVTQIVNVVSGTKYQQYFLVIQAPSGYVNLNALSYTKGRKINLLGYAKANTFLPISYSSSNSKVISVSGTTATIQGKGTATIIAKQSGNALYSPISLNLPVNIN